MVPLDGQVRDPGHAAHGGIVPAGTLREQLSGAPADRAHHGRALAPRAVSDQPESGLRIAELGLDHVLGRPAAGQAGDPRLGQVGQLVDVRDRAGHIEPVAHCVVGDARRCPDVDLGGVRVHARPAHRIAVLVLDDLDATTAQLARPVQALGHSEQPDA